MGRYQARAPTGDARRCQRTSRSWPTARSNQPDAGDQQHHDEHEVGAEKPAKRPAAMSQPPGALSGPAALGRYDLTHDGTEALCPPGPGTHRPPTGAGRRPGPGPAPETGAVPGRAAWAQGAVPGWLCPCPRVGGARQLSTSSSRSGLGPLTEGKGRTLQEREPRASTGPYRVIMLVPCQLCGPAPHPRPGLPGRLLTPLGTVTGPRHRYPGATQGAWPTSDGRPSPAPRHRRWKGPTQRPPAARLALWNR